MGEGNDVGKHGSRTDTLGFFELDGRCDVFSPDTRHRSVCERERRPPPDDRVFALGVLVGYDFL